MQTNDFGDCLSIGIDLTINFGCCSLIGIVWTTDFGDCPLMGIVRTIDFGSGPLIGIVRTMEFWRVLRFENNWQLQLIWAVDQNITPSCLYNRIGKFTCLNARYEVYSAFVLSIQGGVSINIDIAQQ